MSFFLSAAVIPFTAAIVAFLLIGLAEVCITLLLGTGGADFVEAVVADHPLPDVTITNWLLIRELPLLMAILAFIGGFGLSGIGAQVVALKTVGAPFPVYGVVLYSVICGLLSIRLLAKAVVKLNLVSTTAIPTSEFLGYIATLSSQSISQGNAGEASFTDRQGFTHYVLVEPLEPSAEFHRGAQLVLVSQVNSALFHVRLA